MQDLKLKSKVSLTIEGKEIVLRATPVKTDTCDGCYFHNGNTCTLTDTAEDIVGMCSGKVRNDNTSVIFKQANK